MFKLLLSSVALAASFTLPLPFLGPTEVPFPDLSDSDFKAIYTWVKSVADDDCTDVKKGAKKVSTNFQVYIKTKLWSQISNIFKGVSPMAPMVLDMAKDPAIEFVKNASNDLVEKKLCPIMRALSKDTKQMLLKRVENIIDLLKDSTKCPQLRKEASGLVRELVKNWGKSSRESVELLVSFSSNPELKKKAVTAHGLMEESVVMGGDEIVSNHLCRLVYKDQYDSKHDRHHEEL